MFAFLYSPIPSTTVLCLTVAVRIGKHANVPVIQIWLYMCLAILVPSNGNNVTCALANIDSTQVTVSANIFANFND